MCLYFFGFLLAGEAVAPDTDFNPSQHLSYQDVAVDDAQNPSHLQVHPKQILSELESRSSLLVQVVICAQ